MYPPDRYPARAGSGRAGGVTANVNSNRSMSALTSAPTALALPLRQLIGRSFNEYAHCFALDCEMLRGRAVLDVGAGASSFVAEACRRGADAVAVDPLYGGGPLVVEESMRQDRENRLALPRALARRPNVKGREARGHSAWPKASLVSSRARGHFSSFEEAEIDRRAAGQRFLADYEAHLAHGRYVGAALPQLPFLNGAFDLVLCANLLFASASHFDLGWHVAACRELARVSAGEVRIHPVCGVDGRCYAELSQLRRELLSRGVRSNCVPVSPVVRGAGSAMLVLNPEKSG